ncbi:amino acid transporter [Anaerotaenia torta]|uniref:APC family permease n=1 Tax=Anaerotaenia torta TaxID=433293 RepID=UPI003D1B8A8B
MLEKLKEIIIGKPLHNKELQGEKLGVFWGLPIMASDAISSVAYAVEEILWILVLVVGLAAYQYMFMAAVAIVLLLLILVFSYRQTIDSYPNGGGSYTVAKENLGEKPGLLSGASLIIGYILTVAVSTSAGTAAITSAIPVLLPYNVAVTLFLILLMTIGNLRGVKESAKIFAIPTYIFIIAMLIMIVTGLVKVYILGEVPRSVYPIPDAVGDITFFLMIRAFAAGCSGLTGVEAVSNAIPNFKKPAQKNAKRVLGLLAMFVLIIFGGTAFLSTIYHAVPNYDVTVLSQIASQVFGNGIWFYILQVSTAVILIMAANTSYAGLPMLLSLMAVDGYAPRQFGMRGIRLGFSNGILALSAAAGVLVIIYRAETHDLVPLYAIGVFISFTLSQVGMLFKWVRSDAPGKVHKILINGLGALMTVATVFSIAYSKMLEGAWIALVLMAVLMILMKMTNIHYKDTERQLKLEPEEVPAESSVIQVQKHTIVIIGSLNKASLKAINYARRLSEDKNIIAFHVSIDQENSKYLREQWRKCRIPVPLIVKYSPYREIVRPLMKYIESEEHASSPGDMITVVIPQFIVSKSWQNLLHNQTAFAIRKKLIRDRHIAVVTIPYVLDKKP